MQHEDTQEYLDHLNEQADLHEYERQMEEM